MVRIPPAPISGPGVDTRAVAHLRELRKGRVSTLYRTLLHSGDIASGWCELGTAIRWRSSLDDRTRELITCQTARLIGAEHVWRAHAVLAEEAGVTAAQLASLPRFTEEPSFHEREVAALRFTTAVVRAEVDDGLFETAAEHFDRRGLLELAATASYYLAIGRLLDACGVH